jgi:hypothetical protein
VSKHSPVQDGYVKSNQEQSPRDNIEKRRAKQCGDDFACGTRQSG